MPNDGCVTVVGAGLAGCEAAYQLSKRGIHVHLFEMKPGKKSPAHQKEGFAELVCSNSLRSNRLENACGLLKEEMRRLDSFILRAADATQVPAGGALAVDRENFSSYITESIKQNENITVYHEEVARIPDAPAIIATGPLTEGRLFEDIENKVASGLHFYDAAAPVVLADTLDMSVVFRASRYERGDDYLNCPMTKAQYADFYNALVSAETAPLHEFEKNVKVFEGCMPVEVMAKRGENTLCFGPLKPVGLRAPGEERPPYAVVQLRQDDAAGTLYNLVGFQTNLKFAEQQRVFRLIPGMQNAEFVRYGVMHRNTFLSAPGVLGWDYSVLKIPGLYFAGQITGVEGYVESAASGLLAGLSLARRLEGKAPLDFTSRTALGALGHYVAEYAGGNFQPMNINYGIMEPLGEKVRNKALRYGKIAERSLAIVEKLQQSC